MADQDDEERQAHVERIYGKDETKEGGPDNTDLWIDVEMLDQYATIGIWGDIRGQKTRFNFLVDRDEMQYRESTTIKVKNPDDKEQYVKLEVWDKYFSEAIPYAARSVNRHFLNDDSGGTKAERKVEVRKVIHREIDDEFLEIDKTRGVKGQRGKADFKQPPKDPKKYLRAIEKSNDKDEDVYVNVEVIKEWKLHGTGQHVPGLVIQATRFTPALDLSELLTKLPEEKKSKEKPVRTDPLQWIVNVSWGGLAVEFGNHGEDAPKPSKEKK
jgi:hypothetical protein